MSAVNVLYNNLNSLNYINKEEDMLDNPHILFDYIKHGTYTTSIFNPGFTLYNNSSHFVPTFISRIGYEMYQTKDAAYRMVTFINEWFTRNTQRDVLYLFVTHLYSRCMTTPGYFSLVDILLYHLHLDLTTTVFQNSERLRISITNSTELIGYYSTQFNINTVFSDGCSLLTYAISNSKSKHYEDIILCCLHLGANIHDRNTRYNHCQQLLKKYYTYSDSMYYNILQYALSPEELRTEQLLYKLQSALELGYNEEVVRLVNKYSLPKDALLEQNIPVLGFTTNLEITKFLVQKGFSKDNHNGSLLLYTSPVNVRYLIFNGVDAVPTLQSGRLNSDRQYEMEQYYKSYKNWLLKTMLESKYNIGGPDICKYITTFL